METLLMNVECAVKLQAVAAQSGVVEQWGEPALSRAFQWARYCEHVSSGLHGNPAIRRIVEGQLQLTNRKLQAAFPGHSEVSLNDLSRFQHLLLVGLMNNPQLPIAAMKTLFDIPANTEQGDPEDVTGLCGHIIRCKSACEVLRPLADCSAVGADAEIQGAMLMEKLAALLSRGVEAGLAEHFLDSVLQDCEGAAGQLCLVVAAALLTTERSAARTASQDFLLDWLQKRRHLLQLMCSALPAALLIDMAKEHLKFRAACCDVLKTWASDMEYSLNDGEWIQTGTTQTVSFQRVTELFMALFEACPPLREDVEKELKAWKMSDGDFDVRGLSVWGDLLSALNM